MKDRDVRQGTPADGAQSWDQTAAIIERFFAAKVQDLK
jgi:hypothetical protein